MNLVEELRLYFAAATPGMRPIKNLPKDYPAWTFKEGSSFGIAIKYPGDDLIAEQSTNANFYTRDILFEEQDTRFLILASTKQEIREEFASLCENVLLPGENGQNRNKILDDPLGWWTNWTELLGDRKINRSCYCTVAEMMVLDYLFQNDNSIVWSAKHKGTHDIESSQESFEVKSTIKKSESSIEISNQFQLYSAKHLSLWFCRMEESLTGFSINDMKDVLIKHGYDPLKIEEELNVQGFLTGANIRNKKYKVLEARKYIIDDQFPKIIEKSFKNDVFPPNIKTIKYTIDLEGIDYISLTFTLNNDGTLSGKEGAASIELEKRANSKDKQYHIYSEWQEGCIPIYDLRAACGYFEDGKLPEVESWIDVTGCGFTPNKDLYFVVRAQGDSMLDKIKDGDRCVFSWYKGGSRDNKIVLTQIIGTDPDYDVGYTIKKYHREDNEKGKVITLLPLNEDFKEIVIDDSGYKTIGIFELNLDQ